MAFLMAPCFMLMWVIEFIVEHLTLEFLPFIRRKSHLNAFFFFSTIPSGIVKDDEENVQWGAKQLCNAFSTLLIITSYDATNAFFGKNVKKVFKKVPFTHVFKTFRSIGQSARLNSSMFLTCDDVFFIKFSIFHFIVFHSSLLLHFSSRYKISNLWLEWLDVSLCRDVRWSM